MLRDRLRALLDLDLEALGGASLTAECPLTNDVINRVIARRLPPGGPIASALVSAQAGDVILVKVEPRARLLPTLVVEALIERQPVFPDDPVLALRWSLRGAGLVARLAAPFVTNLRKLPPGVAIDGEVILIDVRELLISGGLGEVVELVTALRVTTRPGAIVLSVGAEVPVGRAAGGGGTAAQGGAPHAAGGQ